VSMGSYVQVLNHSGRPWLFLHAEDTGGAVVGDHLDVFVPTTTDAYNITGYYQARVSCSPNFN
jgi:3D (Asp-Asp-Asp) domain-containing protein